MSDKKYPFSCGSQYASWCERNCHVCTKFNEHNSNESCEIDQALLLAEFGDGSVTDEIYTRMNAQAEAYTWDCPEREPK